MLKGYEDELLSIKQKLSSINLQTTDFIRKLLDSPELLQALIAALKQRGLSASDDSDGDSVPVLRLTITKTLAELDRVLQSQQSLEERIKSVEEWKSEADDAPSKLEWMQRQLEMLDDQSSLQGALMVKLCGHANPRRRRSASALPAPTRSPVTASALHPLPTSQPQRPHQPSIASQLSASPAHVNALSPRLAQMPNHHQQQSQQPSNYHQVQQHLQQHQASYNVAPQPTYPYQDPNQRRGY